MNAAEHLAEARTAFEHGALARACDSAWRAASSAAQVGSEDTLQQVVELATALAATGRDDAEQLLRYSEACLEDARGGTRPPSAFERLIGRYKRPRAR